MRHGRVWVGRMYLFDQFVHFRSEVFLEQIETFDRGGQRFLVRHSDRLEHVHGQSFNGVLEPGDPFEMNVVLKIAVEMISLLNATPTT